MIRAIRALELGGVPGSTLLAAALASVSFGAPGGVAAGVCGSGALALAAVAWSRAVDSRSAFLRTWAVFGSAHAVGFSWVIRHPDAGPALAGLLAVVLIPLLISAAWSIAHRVTRNLTAVRRALGLAGVSTLLEFLLHEGPLPLPWGLPSHLVAALPALDGMATVAGSWAPAAFVLAAAVLVDRGSRRTRLLCSLGSALALLIPVPPGPSSGRNLEVALVQPGMAPDRWEQDSLRLGTLKALTDSLLETTSRRPDWVIWPETALRSAADVEWAMRFAERNGIALVSGTLETDADGRRRNAVRVLGTGEDLVISKRHLVPWVEWVPLEALARAVTRDTTPVGSYRRGSGEPVLSVGGTSFGAVVCFESLFPGHASSAARAGARVLVTVTNDSWWGTAAPALAHVAFSRRRAVETGLPLLQASVSGFSGVILPDGTVLSSARWMERRAAVARVSVPAAARGGGLPALPMALILTVAGLSWRRRNPVAGRRVDGPS